MHHKLRQAVAWFTLAQVVLVGVLGTGLHTLFGCEHGPLNAREQGNCCHGCCSFSDLHGEDSERRDGLIGRKRPTPGKAASSVDHDASAGVFACSERCAVCDLLSQYHTAAPFVLEPLSIELIAGEATLHLGDAVVSAATRLALSRGPPAD
ncbi:MAG: hypothetical protein AAF961_05090 [Planctomycetota bacterium]